MADRKGPPAGMLNSLMKFGDDGRLDRQENQHHHHENQHNLFSDINNLRIPQLENDIDPYAEEHAKYNDTFFGLIAKHKAFEITTLSIISLNAVAIGYDTDYDARWGKPSNLYDGPIGFIVLEWTFAIYFSFEVIVRFMAYKSKLDCIFDAWFVFDSVLVTMMVVETWVLPFIGSGGPLGQLSILRLLRLLRITRMARLMRAVPEMLVIIKGMLASTRTVACTGLLLVSVLYIFGILFTAEYHQPDIPDTDEAITEPEAFFGSMGKSMFTLFIMGTVLDDYTQATNAVRSSGNYWMLFAFILFTLISSFMMLNMLIGILVEVIAATSEGEESKAHEEDLRASITHIFEQMDKDSNQLITKSEFMSMKDDKDVMNALDAMDIHDKSFHLYAELFFRPDEVDGSLPSLSYNKLVTMILRLRPGTSISQLDFALFHRAICDIYDRIRDRVVKIERLCVDVARLVLGDDLDQGICSTESDHSFWKVSKSTSPSDSPRRKGSSYNNGTARDSVPRRSARSALNAHDRQRLTRLTEAEIIDELQRRVGVPDVDKFGVPHSMLDDELQARLEMASKQNSCMQQNGEIQQDRAPNSITEDRSPSQQEEFGSPSDEEMLVVENQDSELPAQNKEVPTRAAAEKHRPRSAEQSTQTEAYVRVLPIQTQGEEAPANLGSPDAVLS